MTERPPQAGGLLRLVSAGTSAAFTPERLSEQVSSHTTAIMEASRKAQSHRQLHFLEIECSYAAETRQQPIIFSARTTRGRRVMMFIKHTGEFSELYFSEAFLRKIRMAKQPPQFSGNRFSPLVTVWVTTDDGESHQYRVELPW